MWYKLKQYDQAEGFLEVLDETISSITYRIYYLDYDNVFIIRTFNTQLITEFRKNNIEFDSHEAFKILFKSDKVEVIN